MAKVFISTNGSFTSASADDIFGTSGNETVNILSALTPGSRIDQNVERIVIDTNALQMRTQGNTLIFTDANNTQLCSIIARTGMSVELPGGVATVAVNGLNNIDLTGPEGSIKATGTQQVVDTSTLFGGTGEPVFSLSPLTTEVVEGDDGFQTQAMGVTVERNGFGGDLTIDLQARASSPASATAGVDFVAETIPVTIFANASFAAVDVRILGDTLHEPSETFVATLVEGSQTSGSINPSAQASTLTIIDDDPAPQTIQPTAQEQFMLELINRARQDPNGEATRFNIALNEGLAPDTLAGDARQPLAFNTGLTVAARNHSQDMLDNDFFAHDNLAGESFADRIREAGYTFASAGENIAFRGTTATLTEAAINSLVETLHQDLFVDEGVAGRGHRLNILQDNFKEVGIGIRSGEFTNPNGTFNTVMATQDFGAQPDAGAILLGVIYQDTDNNDFYTPGEGVGEVEIDIVNTDTNQRQTLQSLDAGGYQVSLDAGTYDITYTAGNDTRFIDDLLVGVNNIKLDWVIGAAVFSLV